MFSFQKLHFGITHIKKSRTTVLIRRSTIFGVKSKYEFVILLSKWNAVILV